MFDITFLIPDYPDWNDDSNYMPPCPDDEMPNREKERLNMEIYYAIDAGAFDPNNEIIY